MSQFKAKFRVLNSKSHIEGRKKNVVYLNVSTWDDYTFKTQFILDVSDESAVTHNIGSLKIGYYGQKSDTITSKELGQTEFDKLDKEFFSVGQGPEFYENLMLLSKDMREFILSGLNDVVYDEDILKKAMSEDVFKISLLRSNNINTVKGQYRRLLNGDKLLDDFHFTFVRNEHKKYSDLRLGFKVTPFSKPQTNIHSVIGRNGVGKTTLLNDMVNSIIGNRDGKNQCSYFKESGIFTRKITKDYFSAVISVSFSAFDPFIPLDDQDDPTMGTCYYYIGLKKKIPDSSSYGLYSSNELRDLCISSLTNCLSETGKASIWKETIKSLESDSNFCELDLLSLANLEGEELKNECNLKMADMSSGHVIVFLIITNLIEKTQDKTLLLIDEPESHLHPPLLSALIRAISNLLYKRNGVAIIATHSPVVLQEVPRSCTWVLTRYGNEMAQQRPEKETFGENVGLLTKEVFQLEVDNSGYLKLLQESVNEGKSFEKIMEEYDNQIGYEGQALLRGLILIRSRKEKNNSLNENNGEW